MAAEAESLILDSQPPQSQPEKVSVSFSIWPPTQCTRDAVLSRLIETLSAPSVLSKRYGPVPADEMVPHRRRQETLYAERLPKLLGKESSDKLQFRKLKSTKEFGKETKMFRKLLSGFETQGRKTVSHDFTSPVALVNGFKKRLLAQSMLNDFIFPNSTGRSTRFEQPEMLSSSRPMFLGSFFRLVQSSRSNNSSPLRNPIDSQTSSKPTQPLRINFSRLGSLEKLKKNPKLEEPGEAHYNALLTSLIAPHTRPLDGLVQKHAS
ncbi:hypothetical protein RJ640_002540 [Escallonia rubra]|uniref:WPP domain-containing protein n=1 Tax=Escallonia rubra TaxID=112253 RepID=A0AA88RZE6_9ASTE|nr:hypothetical protein RJ640_002540 [Escallonia rubra]